MRKRVKQLLKFYVVIITLALTFGLCFNVIAKDYNNKFEDETTLVKGQVIVPNDKIYADYSEYSIVYCDETGENCDYKHISASEPHTVKEVKKPYNAWEITDIEYYGSVINNVFVKPVNKTDITDPTDQTVNYGYTANFETMATSPYGEVSYRWYQNKEKDITNSVKVDTEKLIESENSYKCTTTENGNCYLDIKNLNFPNGGYITFDYMGNGSIDLNASNDDNTYIDYKSFSFDTKTSQTKKIYIPDNIGNLNLNLYIYYITDEQKPVIISNIKVVEKNPIDTGITTNKLSLSTSENEQFYQTGNKFYAVIKDGTKTYKTASAKLTINNKSNKFEDDPNSIILDKEIDKNYKLRIIDITSKTETNVFEKLNSTFTNNRKSISIFNVGMYEDDKLIDIGEGNYILNVEIPETLKNYTDIKVSELDENYNVINTEIPEVNDNVYTFKVNKLNNFTFTGIELTNPQTSSTSVITFTIIMIVALVTVGTIFYNKNLEKKKVK